MAGSSCSEELKPETTRDAREQNECEGISLSTSIAQSAIFGAVDEILRWNDGREEVPGRGFRTQATQCPWLT
jgi:hypothetical protein